MIRYITDVDLLIEMVLSPVGGKIPQTLQFFLRHPYIIDAFNYVTAHSNEMGSC